jgi:hypothetical protein
MSVLSRQFSEAHRRAIAALSQPRLSASDVLHVLEAVPQPENTTRAGVIPPGHTFVHSQAVGLTTQRGGEPSVSGICRRCPAVVKLLCKFALQHDPEFKFTTITLNYNYASAPHRDVNHEDGKARIIALGDFSGGDLSIEGHRDPINIKDVWFDFDGRLLHGTNPFVGERYSLVYFTHLCWTNASSDTIIAPLVELGIPWPGAVAASLPFAAEEAVSDTFSSYLCLPTKNLNPQYNNFCKAEIDALLSLDSEIYALTESNACDEHTAQALLPGRLVELVPRSKAVFLSLISSRAVSFFVWRVLGCSSRLQDIQSAAARGGRPLPLNYSLEIIAPGRRLSTRQRRSVLMLACLTPSAQTSRSAEAPAHVTLALVLVYDSTARPDGHIEDKLHSVRLCELVQSTKANVRDSEVSFGDAAEDISKDLGADDIPADDGHAPPTPLKRAHCRLLCNLARVRPGDLVLDPFCGSGSILATALDFRACCIGSDAKAPDAAKRLMAGRPHIELVTANVYHHQLLGGGRKYDAIICDPPYGRREKHVDAAGVDFFRHSSNEERALAQMNVLIPLLHLAAVSLRPGGRLVFLFLK